MARPALSASRTMDIFDLFTAFPARGFLMSEIIKATGINVASCHAVLNALTARGYLIRRGKHYQLGSALIAVGQAAAQTHDVIGLAQAAAAALNTELEVAVLLSTLAGDDILALTALPNEAGHFNGVRAGQRIPLIPPLGTHFLAWGSDADIARWIARGNASDADEIESWRGQLAITRSRGYQVTLRASDPSGLAELMTKMASGRQPIEYKSQASDLALVHDWSLRQPEVIAPETSYDVALIAAPIFDRDGHALLSLGLGGFGASLTGRQITDLAERLMTTCLHVMQAARTD